MIRSFLFAVGLMVGATGVACLQVDRVILKSRGTPTTPTGWRRFVTRVSNDRREVIGVGGVRPDVGRCGHHAVHADHAGSGESRRL